MDFLDRETVTSLAGHQGWPSISIYLPTHRAGSEKEQDRIRLKNLVRSACANLVATGMREPDAESFCAPARALVEDDTTWRSTSEGMAVFVSAEGARVVSTDTTLPEQSVVGDRFYLRPLMPALHGESHFFALALSKNGSRLFSCDRASIDQIDLPDAPASIAEVTKYDVPEESLQHSSIHSGQAGIGGGRPTTQIYHGHGGEKDVDKIQSERYLRAVERAVSAALKDEHEAPLILMGVDYLVAMYRDLNTYPLIVSEQVLGATDEMTPHAVHAAASAALVPHFDSRLDTALTELAEKGGSGLVSRDPVEIVAAAIAGRVKTIFLDDGIGPFGRFDRSRFGVEEVCADMPRLLRETADTEDAAPDCGWDLVDLAAAETALHGGSIHAFVGESAPVHGVAAVYRY